MQRYGKDGGIDWDLNVDSEAIIEPGKAGQPTDSKENSKPKGDANIKENDAPTREIEAAQGEITEEGVSEKNADPEAEIDSDEEAALREAGL